MTDSVTITIPHGMKQHAASIWQAIADDVRAVGRHWIAAQIEEQVKPAVEEPEDFGSIVQAWHPSEDPSGTPPDLWQRSPMNGKHYWENRNGVCEVWSDLVHPQVLRVGIGEDHSDSYNMGRTDFAEAMRRDISALRAAAVGAERKNAYDNALATIAALLGES